MIDINYILSQYPGAKLYQDGFEVSLAKHNGAAGKIVPAVQEKKWGGEAWLVYTDKYALKMLYISQGHRLSLQRHQKKEETWQVAKGRAEITLGSQKFVASPGDVIHVAPGTVHRLAAPNGDVEILEVSSPELWDLERIEDDYHRKQYEGKTF
ncbi:MAG: cupin domain-containing protein [Patescibacteria group bacterium]|nr:cupin domain-containing protein [Patescibacteria group bacterium]